MRTASVASIFASLIVFIPHVGFGQSAAPPVEFEVADVKVNDSGQVAIEARVLPSGQISVRNIRMKELILQAYKAADVAGGPAWLDSERFDVVAKAPPNTTEDTLRLMLQSLLVKRVKLRVHQEQKTLPVYALVASARGFKLSPSAGAGQPRCSPGQGAEGMNHTVCTNFTMADLANWLSTRIAPSFISRPVLDLTGLKGTYDIRLDWVPQPLVGNAGDSADVPAGTTVFEALEKQLGLKLEQRRSPVPVIVIDYIERVSTEN